MSTRPRSHTGASRQIVVRMPHDLADILEARRTAHASPVAWQVVQILRAALGVPVAVGVPVPEMLRQAGLTRLIDRTCP